MTLAVDQLQVSYGKHDILKGVGLEVQPGQLVGLLGSNGAGKSTLIKTIAGINRPQAGSVTWQGETDLTTIARRDLAQLVAYVPQNINLAFSQDVRESVLLGRTPYFGTRPRDEDWEHVDRALAALGLEELADRSVGELSGGQAQRVLIARALAQDPTILLLDEPTSALDIRYQWETLTLAQRIARESGVAAVIAIHDLNQAARFCDQVVFLQGGEILAAGAPIDVYSSEIIRQVYGIDVELSIYRGFVEIHPLSAEDRGQDRPAESIAPALAGGASSSDLRDNVSALPASASVPQAEPRVRELQLDGSR